MLPVVHSGSVLPAAERESPRDIRATVQGAGSRLMTVVK